MHWKEFVRQVGQLPRIIAWCTVNKTLNSSLMIKMHKEGPVSSEGVKSKVSLWNKEQYDCSTGQFSDKIKSLKYYLCPQQNMLPRQCNQTKTPVPVSYTVAAQQLGKKTLSQALNLGIPVSLQSLKELCPKKMESFTDARIFWNQFTRITERSKPLHYCWLTVEEIAVTVQSNAWVCDGSIAEFKDSNPAERMNLCIMCSFRVWSRIQSSPTE